ncbi:putative amidohydrolase YtcJ [Microbacterium resistens]|uniref:Amidohydrolase YtcJ n=1 Tax=Microbacterium resistens TaxID=156977 RepID=A0ABU1S904_9MICO|nr:amidohydrolase family protein [Microbacterium resistens]MDR6866076.1 putative amidohydrolase YtcJ [Microbacterium resistens]
MTFVSALRAVRIASADRRLLATDDPVDVLIEDGRIADIAPTGALRFAGEVLDGGGAWLVPGLWDHHVHTVQWALAAQRVPLADSGSAADAARRMADAGTLGDGRRVGTGYRAVRWADEPSLALLDQATGEIPTYLINADVHSVWLNSAAFRREGFAPVADGLLREQEAFEISRRLNAADPIVADAAVAAAAARAAARGVVGMVDFDMSWNREAWTRRLSAGFDGHRVEFAVYPDDLDRAIAEGLVTGEALSDDPALDPYGLVRMGALKVISDGSLGTRTAACSHGYADDPENHGLLTVPPAALRELLTTATGAGIAAAVHAIGDVALSSALDVFGETGAQGSIEHAQLVRQTDLARFARLGIAASVQPQHAIDDRDAADALWAGQHAIVYPLGSLHRAGIPLRFGSDAPVAPLDPWLAISAAMHRTDDDRPSWHDEERLDVETALAASAHRGTGGEAAIRPGAVADLVLCAEDPATAGPSRLRSMPVAATIVGGRITHDGVGYGG